jgi:hypothetical protein
MKIEMSKGLEIEIRVFLAETLCGLNGYIPVNNDMDVKTLKTINDALISLINHHLDGMSLAFNQAMIKQESDAKCVCGSKKMPRIVSTIKKMICPECGLLR